MESPGSVDLDRGTIARIEVPPELAGPRQAGTFCIAVRTAYAPRILSPSSSSYSGKYRPDCQASCDLRGLLDASH